MSSAAPDKLSTLRTSWTEAEETANSCPLTRKRMICSVFAELGLAGAARRISELLREPWGKFPERAFRWRHKYRRFRAPDQRHRLYSPRQACRKSRMLPRPGPTPDRPLP